MNHQELLKRILDARTVLGTLKVEGVAEMRKLVSIYDHMTQTAQMIEQEQKKENEE